jgi:hypothetical protein
VPNIYRSKLSDRCGQDFDNLHTQALLSFGSKYLKLERKLRFGYKSAHIGNKCVLFGHKLIYCGKQSVFTCNTHSKFDYLNIDNGNEYLLFVLQYVIRGEHNDNFGDNSAVAEADTSLKWRTVTIEQQECYKLFPHV